MHKIYLAVVHEARANHAMKALQHQQVAAHLQLRVTLLCHKRNLCTL